MWRGARPAVVLPPLWGGRLTDRKMTGREVHGVRSGIHFCVKKAIPSGEIHFCVWTVFLYFPTFAANQQRNDMNGIKNPNTYGRTWIAGRPGFVGCRLGQRGPVVCKGRMRRQYPKRQHDHIRTVPPRRGYSQIILFFVSMREGGRALSVPTDQACPSFHFPQCMTILIHKHQIKRSTR